MERPNYTQGVKNSFSEGHGHLRMLAPARVGHTALATGRNSRAADCALVLFAGGARSDLRGPTQQLTGRGRGMREARSRRDGRELAGKLRDVRYRPAAAPDHRKGTFSLAVSAARAGRTPARRRPPLLLCTGLPQLITVSVSLSLNLWACRGRRVCLCRMCVCVDVSLLRSRPACLRLTRAARRRREGGTRPPLRIAPPGRPVTP